MAVQVDIPGFGMVEAKDAASESTLKEILRALQGKGGSSGGAGGGGGGAGAGGPQGGFAGVMQKAAKGTGKFTDQIKETRTALQDFAAGLKMVGGMITGAFGAVATGAQGLAMELISGGNRMSDFLQHIPFVGNALAGLTGLLEQQVDNFRDLSEVGAGFGNSVLGLTKAATEAGMGVSQFSEFVGQNSQNMMLLGGTTTEGAKAFGRLTRQIRNSDRDFQGMGFTFEALNEHTVEYMDQLAMQGRLSGMSQAELRKGSEDYLMQIDRLAKVTGKSRKEAEALLKKQAAEANVQVMASKLSGKALENFQNNIAFVDSELPGFSNAIKDMADGVAQTPLAQKLAATIPGFADLQKEMASGSLSQEEYTKRMAAFGPQIDNFVKSMDPAMVQALMGKEGFGEMMNGMAEYNKFSTKYRNADFKKMEEEQKARDKTTSQLANFETKIAEIRAKIMQTLIDSGVLDKLNEQFGNLMEWFTNNGEGLTDSIGTVMEDVLTYASEFATFLKDAWKAADGDLGKFFSTIWEEKLSPALTNAMAKVGEIFGSWFGNFFKEHLGKLIAGVLGGIAGLIISGFVTSLLPTVFGIILGPIIAPFLAIGAALLAIFGWETIKGWVGAAWDAIVWVFKGIGDMFSWIWEKVQVPIKFVWSIFSTMFGWIGDTFGWIYDKVKAPIMVIYNAISSMFGWIGDTVDWIWGKIKALNPFSWFGGDDDEDEAEKKIAEKKNQTVGLSAEEMKEYNAMADEAGASTMPFSPTQTANAIMPDAPKIDSTKTEDMPDFKKSESTAGNGFETAEANVNSSSQMSQAMAELLYEQNRILKAQLSAIRGLQGNLLKGLG
jgi:uncharacterized protein YukE